MTKHTLPPKAFQSALAGILHFVIVPDKKQKPGETIELKERGTRRVICAQIHQVYAASKVKPGLVVIGFGERKF